MDSYYNFLSQSDKSTISSLKKKSPQELRKLKKEADEKLNLLLTRKYNSSNNSKINYLSNRKSLIDYVLKKYK